MEKRHNYVRKVAETAVTHFITNDKPNVSGIGARQIILCFKSSV